MNRIPQHGHDTWVPPSRRVPGRLPSGSCTVDAYGSEAGDAWGRGAGAAPARQTHGVAGPERLVPQNVCSPVRPHYAVSTMTAPYLPVHGSITVRSSPQFSPRHDVLVHGLHHHAQQQRRLWPIRSVDPSAFTVTTTLGRAPCAWFPPCMTMETGSLIKQVRLLGLASRPRDRAIISEVTDGVRAIGAVRADGAARSRTGLCLHCGLLGST